MSFSEYFVLFCKKIPLSTHIEAIPFQDPEPLAHIGDAAEILTETEDFIRKQAVLAYDRCMLFREENNMALDLVAFREEDPFLQKRILLRYMEQLTPYRKDITKEHIEALMQLTQKDGSREIFLKQMKQHRLCSVILIVSNCYFTDFFFRQRLFKCPITQHSSRF